MERQMLFRRVLKETPLNKTKKLPIAVGLLKWNVLTCVQHLRGIFYDVFMMWRFILSKNWQLF